MACPVFAGLYFFTAIMTTYRFAVWTQLARHWADLPPQDSFRLIMTGDDIVLDISMHETSALVPNSLHDPAYKAMIGAANRGADRCWSDATSGG